MEEDGGGEADGIDAVEHAAVALYHVAPVFDAVVALDGRHDESAEESHQADNQPHRTGLPRVERGNRCHQDGQYGGRGDAADGAGNGFGRG